MRNKLGRRASAARFVSALYSDAASGEHPARYQRGLEMKAAILTIAVAFAAALAGGTGALLATATTASAQSTPRSVCCKQMGGRWAEGRSRAKAGQMVCYGVSGDAYYKCVASKTR